jgi:hypothetical protein
MKLPLTLILTFVSGLAFAQQGGIGAVTVQPNPARAGGEVKITVSAAGESPGLCGMVVHFDDGSESRNVKIDGKEGKFPVSFSKTYAKPGTYGIKAEGKKITTHFPCTGVATAKLVVEAAPAEAKPAAPASVMCPDGYKLVGKAGKAGDFTCKGGKSAAAPAKPLVCAEGLVYFANAQAKQIGCRKPKASKK